MTPTGAAVVGCGVIGTRRAVALERCGVPVRAVFDVDGASAARLGGVVGGAAKVTASLDEAIGRDDVQLVVVATTHSSLAPIAQRAADSGRHVLVEKPGADALAPVEALAGIGRDRNVTVRCGYNHRFHPAVIKAKSVVASGRYGDVLHVRARYGHGGRPGYESEWRAQRHLSGGGELIDQGSHLIDLTRHLVGDVELVFSELRTEYWEMQVEDNAYLALRGVAGGFAWLHASWSEWKNLFSFEITLRRAKVEITGLGGSYGPERLTVYELGPSLGPPEITSWEWPPGDDSWALEVDDVLAELDGRESCGAGVGDAVAAFRIIDEAYRR